MLNINLKNKKYFYILNFRTIFLNYNYLSFLKKKTTIESHIMEISKICDSINLGFLKIRFNGLISLFVSNKYFQFLKNNHYIVYYNDYFFFQKVYEKFNNFSLFAFCFSGYFINNNYLSNINSYYLFYYNNFKIFIIYINLFINKYIYITYIYIYKILQSLIILSRLK